MELNFVENFYSKYSNFNREKFSDIGKFIIDQDLTNSKKGITNMKNESSPICDCLKSTDTSRSTEYSKSSSENYDHDLELFKQNINTYVELLKKFIKQFQRSINIFKINNFSFKSKSKKISTKTIDLYSLSKIFKRFKTSSKFLIVSKILCI